MRVRLIGVGLCLLALGLGSAAAAQDYTPNCGLAPDADELAIYQRKVCADFLPCKMVQDIGNTGCRVANGLKNLFTSKARDEEPRYDALPEIEKPSVWQRIKLSVSDVFEAASPPLTPEATLAIERGVSKVSAEAAAKSPGAYSGMLDPNKAGRTGYYEGQLINGKPDGAGTVIGPDGRMVRGEFQDGALKRGEVVRQDGVIMAGRWENGVMNGRGAVQLANGVVEASNTYKDGTPIGPLTRTYPDGSREIQVRDPDGKVVATGPRASKGQEPQAPTYTPPMAGGPSGRGIIIEQFDRCIGTPNNNFCKEAKPTAPTPPAATPANPIGGIFGVAGIGGNIAAMAKVTPGGATGAAAQPRAVAAPAVSAAPAQSAGGLGQGWAGVEQRCGPELQAYYARPASSQYDTREEREKGNRSFYAQYLGAKRPSGVGVLDQDYLLGEMSMYDNFPTHPRNALASCILRTVWLQRGFGALPPPQMPR